MANRRQSREWAVQVLFQLDFNPDGLDRTLDTFWEERDIPVPNRAFADELVRGVMANKVEIDDLLQKYAENWDLARMAAVDRNVMRVGLFEMLCCPDIPPVVSINEAIELVKQYSGGESKRFVNGILDRARKSIDRPARVPVAVEEGQITRFHSIDDEDVEAADAEEPAEAGAQDRVADQEPAAEARTAG